MSALMGFRTWKRAMSDLANKDSQMIKTKMGDVQYTDIGSGPVILHSHGSPGGCDSGPLAFSIYTDSGFRIVTTSRPGFIKTPLDIGRTVEGQADIFAAFLDELNIDRVSILAWSGGGPPALQFALRHPDRLLSLVLLACVTIRWEHKTTLFEKAFMTDTGLWTMSVIYAIMPGSDKSMCKEIGADYNYVKQHPDKLKFLRRFMCGISPGSLRWPGSENDVIQYSKLPRYPVENIKCPTLVVQSDSDNLVSMANAKFIVNTVPKVEFYKYATGGHVPMLGQQSEEVYDKMLDFIKKYSSN